MMTPLNPITFFAIAAASCLAVSSAAPAGPAGIFVIGDTHAVVGEVAKFDLPHVAGYTLRVPWTDIETWNSSTQAVEYNFSRLDTTLEELRARGKRMTLEIFINKAPDYLMALPGITTWTNPNPNQGGVQPLPWDTLALAAYQAMITALANHTVPGTSWRVADHPSLESVDSSIVGLQGLRELSNTLVNHPGYTRARFSQAVVDSVTTSRSAFSGKFGFFPIFAMSDNEAGIPLDQAIFERLQMEFNVPGKPTLGYFQETLSDAGPRTDTLGLLLHTASPQTYVMFQALRPWTLRAGESLPVEIASGTPVTGIRHAWRNYRSTYVELYGADILAAANAAPLLAWNHFFLAVKNAREGRDVPTLDLAGTQSQRLIWQKDGLLDYRIWKSPDLAAWTPVQSTETMDGDVLLPSSPAEVSHYYRMEILEPANSISP
ncbi:MAG: hypothetical protein ABIS50_24100 [Luteolibacter sp.]|uniref:hypothetical protein n=1 Tax=Luteolibacter sp. TaxID=1962973 RepID=UPI0032655478